MVTVTPPSKRARPDAGDASWCLHLSYLRPHWPYLAPAPYHNLFTREHVIDAVRDARELRNPHPLYAAFMAQEYSRNFSRDAVRETVAPVYMGLIREVDDNLGRLFEFMRAHDLFDDTLIIFTADHGDYLGDHHLGEKDLFHEPSVRIPLLIRDPCAAADATRDSVNDDLVGAVDVLPTLVAFAGGAKTVRAEMFDKLFYWMRNLRARTEVSTDELLKRGPARDEAMGIIIGRW